VSVTSLSRVSRQGMLAGVILVLALAGCSSPAADPASGSDGAATSAKQPSVEEEGTASDEGGTASGIPDPCMLLTPAEIESITGFPVADGVADPERQSEYSALCEWTQADDLGTVTIALAPGYPVPYEEEDTPLGKTVAIEIPGASEAFSVSDGLSVGMSVDGTYVSVAFSGALNGERAEVTIALATLVASRLG